MTPGRFIVVVENLSKAEADALTAYVDRQEHWAYWHWIEGFWLILRWDNPTAKEFWNAIAQAMPSLESKTMLVMRVDDPVTYWGRADKAAWDWLKISQIGEPR